MPLPLPLLHAFHGSTLGRQAAAMIARPLGWLWPDRAEAEILVLGWPQPYLPPLVDQARRLVGAMALAGGGAGDTIDAAAAAAGGGASGPRGHVLCAVDAEQLPLPDGSLDAALLVHVLEHAESPERVLREVWRVLKPEARLLAVLPNRTGLWALGDRTPFGHGAPYSLSQAIRLLDQCFFAVEGRDGALWGPPWAGPPWAGRWTRRLLLGWERTGRALWPTASGVHIMVARKTLLGGTAVPVAVRGRRMAVAVAPGPNGAPKDGAGREAGVDRAAATGGGLGGSAATGGGLGGSAATPDP